MILSTKELFCKNCATKSHEKVSYLLTKTRLLQPEKIILFIYTNLLTKEVIYTMTIYAEDKSMIFYTYLTAIFAIEKSVPIKALLIKNPRNDTVIIFRQKKNGGAIKTRRFVLDKAERVFFLNSISHDFPHLPLEVLESEKV